jgi:hypothetical protein
VVCFLLLSHQTPYKHCSSLPYMLHALSISSFFGVIFGEQYKLWICLIKQWHWYVSIPPWIWNQEQCPLHELCSLLVYLAAPHLFLLPLLYLLHFLCMCIAICEVSQSHGGVSCYELEDMHDVAYELLQAMYVHCMDDNTNRNWWSFM